MLQGPHCSFNVSYNTFLKGLYMLENSQNLEHNVQTGENLDTVWVWCVGVAKWLNSAL